MGKHRAERRSRKDTANRSTSPATPAGGRRKATRATRSRPLLAPLGKVPALPTVAGAFALVTAAGGALGVGHGLGNGSGIELSVGAANVSGANAGVKFADRDPRAQAISRDSERQALKDAAHAELVEAAEEQSQQRNAALASLAKDAEARAEEIAKNNWILPLEGYRLSARFGASSGLWSSTHTGQDLSAPVGTPIVAIANGTITETGYDGSYGNKTVLTLEDGTEIWFCHQSSIGVEPGDRVTQGDQIGEVGSTGNSTGPHLHIEVRPGGGDPIDPNYAFIQHGITF